MQYNPVETLFFDIETVPCVKSYEELNPAMQQAWEKKCRSLAKEHPDSTPAELWSRAGLYAEFSKVVCISIGFYKETGSFDILSCYGSDEHKVLHEFCQKVQQFYVKRRAIRFAGHNIIGFDVPYLCRRMLLQKMSIPAELWSEKLKSYEYNRVYLDTMKLWAMGHWKETISLNTLCAAMGIPSPKEELSGDKVGAAYWDENRLEDIRKYCEQDVLALARVIRYFNKEEPMDIELPQNHELF